MHQKHHADYDSKTAADTALVGDTDHDEEYLAAAAAAAAALNDYITLQHTHRERGSKE